MNFFHPSFAYSTLVINIVGSFFISFVMHIGLHSDLIPLSARIILTTGVLGGFTTYSSFNQEVFNLFQEGAFAKGLFHLLAMVTLCLLAGYVGFILAKRVIG